MKADSADQRAGLSQGGQAFIEYFVISLVILLATVAFYRAHLEQEGRGARGHVEAAFWRAAAQILDP